MTRANQAHADLWDGEGGQRWVADADRRDVVLAPVADTLIAAAQLQRGERVLDIGCGCGATTIAAAVITGEATGLDLSGPMLEVARRRAGDAPVTFVKDDAQTYEFTPASFDVVISRFGSMFFDDPVTAFANIGRAVEPGGRMCLATWQPLAANEWLTAPNDALLRYGSLPVDDANEPGMFAQSDPDIVDRVLAAAGWDAVRVEPVAVTLRIGEDAADATDYVAGLGITRRILETIDDATKPQALADVRRVLDGRAAPDGSVSLGAAINIITARP